MLNKNKNNKGFTLVELLVVIAIIGILAVVAVPALFKNIAKAKATDIIGDTRAIKTSIMAEYADGKNLSTFNNLTETLVNQKNIQSELNIEDLSKEATYKLVTTDSSSNSASRASAKLEITVNNKSIADRIKEQWGQNASNEELPGENEEGGEIVVTTDNKLIITIFVAE